MDKKIALLISLIAFVVSAVSAEVMDRRKEQFLHEKGYLFLPAPYSMPGIGQGIAYYAGFNNYFGYSDIFAVKTTGDVRGDMFGLWDVHFLDKRLYADLMVLDFDRVAINNYSKRGMGSGKDDYSISELNEYKSKSIKTVLSYFDRRLEFIGKYSEEDMKVIKILDNDGNLISNIVNPELVHQQYYDFTVLADLTDDRQDPRRGVRGELIYGKSEPQKSSDVDYYTTSINLTGYVPFGSANTWVVNYFHSDATVISEGESDKSVLDNEYGCTYGITCPQSVIDKIDNTYLHNTKGTARNLGGNDRLRSYPQGRFQGAYSRAFGTELRFNFFEGKEPVDLKFMKDIRTGVQLATFYEVGTVSDDKNDLWKKTKASYGGGVRFIMGSGFVYRFDYAIGDEGSELTIFVTYPWEDM